MGPIGNIYWNDMRKLWTNTAAAVVILGLVFLPSLYAWFNIEASWDPYGHTEGLKVAVVNEDEGTTVRGRNIRLGDEIVTALNSNKAIGWVFMDGEQALDEVRHGDIYAAVTIPSDFSAKIATVLVGKPQKAEIGYTVNEKINAIAPKITAKGASGIVEEVRGKFVKTANEAIFSVLNEIGGELQTNKPAIEQVRDTVFRLESMIPEINHSIEVAQNDVAKAEKIARKVQDDLPVVEQLAKQGADAASRTANFLESSSIALDTAVPDFKQTLQRLEETARYITETGAALQAALADHPEQVADLPDLAIPRLTTAVGTSKGLLQALEGLNKLGAEQPLLSSASTRVQSVYDLLEKQLQAATSIREALANNKEPSQTLAHKISDLSGRASSELTEILKRYDAEIAPGIRQAADRAKVAAHEAQRVLTDAVAGLPDVEGIVSDASKGLVRGAEELARIRQAMPAAESKIEALADRIRQLEKEGNLDELIALLTRSAEQESDFFAEPVVLKETRLYPVPNYGSAMSPFFTTLSLWVGALLLVSLIPVEIHGSAVAYESYQVYLGRYLTFATLAIAQSIIVTFGDLFLLHAYVADKLPFVLFGILLSVVFMFMVYTLVSVFGNVGKAIAIVLLVLQLAGSGGTFPIEVHAPFFQAIHPFLPFTYGISLMREAVGGMLWDIAVRDMEAIAIFAGIAFVLGVVLKERINRASAALVRKAKESGLIH
ncbi:YhgE/Pip family protein [Cohnella yongneupensis]|uniref:YhgE/Pip family protein n=1 Tax=Cohnella yongneupensis TaxID=425006 RepID=A0ABW0R4C0_9BACL